MKIAFFGTPAFAAEFLKGLIADSTFEVVAVVTQPDEPMGRKKILTAPHVKLVAIEHGIPVFQPTKLKDETFQKNLKDTGAELGVVVAYGRILPEAVLSVFAHGCVNVHPSLLPKYRGPSPIIAAIASGDIETAVTVMKLVQEMDAGPILAQAGLLVAADETTESLTKKVVDIGVPLLVETLKGFVAGKIVPTEQDHSQATFCKLLTREDGVIDWSQPAEVIERKARAFNPWPGTSSAGFKVYSAVISEQTLPIGQAKVVDARIFIGTATAALEILELQAPAGKRLKAKDFLNGHKDFDGQSFLA